MRACVLTATGGLAHVTVTHVPDPGPPGPGQVRIAVQAAALNHLDLFVAQGLPGADSRFPHIMGADGAGLVDAVGAGVTRARPGERVLINPGIADYRCDACRAGEHQLCVNFRLLGEHLSGTLAEYV
ncbi:MAG TPA: alcohol dehydrogenase catalytic domain-containing protein, partial [Gemmatimonadales bacterium]